MHQWLQENTARLLASISFYGAQLGYGACSTLLGASLSSFGSQFGVSSSELGVIWIYAGVGYAIGLYASMEMMKLNYLYLPSKVVLTCFCSFLMAFCQFLILNTKVQSFNLLKLLIFIMEIFMGMNDNFTSVSLYEMWGKHVQPWAQTRSFVFACGGVLATFMLQSYDLANVSTLAIILCMSASVGILIDVFLATFGTPLINVKGNEIATFLSDNRVRGDSITSPRSRSRSGSRSGSRSRSESLLAARERSSSVLSESLPIRSRCVSNADEQAMLSTDIAMMQLTLANQELWGGNGLESPMNASLPRDSRVNSDARCSISAGSAEANEVDELRSLVDVDNSLISDSIPDTLAFATPQIIQAIKDIDDQSILSENRDITKGEENRDITKGEEVSGVYLVRPVVQAGLVLMMVFWSGASVSMYGWLPTYSAMMADSDSNFGEFLLFLWFSTRAVACMISIPLSMMFSTTVIMRAHLSFVAVGALILVFSYDSIGNKTALCLACICFSYGLSIIFSLTLTVVNDYGLTMDESATGLATMGTAVGGSLLPLLVGNLMNTLGPSILLISGAIQGVALVATYIFVDWYMARTLNSRSAETGISPSLSILGLSRNLSLDLELMRMRSRASSIAVPIQSTGLLETVEEEGGAYGSLS